MLSNSVSGTDVIDESPLDLLEVRDQEARTSTVRLKLGE
jgi:hypothetical protein